MPPDVVSASSCLIQLNAASLLVNISTSTLLLFPFLFSSAGPEVVDSPLFHVKSVPPAVMFLLFLPEAEWTERTALPDFAERSLKVP
jgi:hypothetical protein